ncbi:MAG: transposase, partial [Bacteroides sp.]|nr:transposase [Bacteroides sp.]
AARFGCFLRCRLFHGLGNLQGERLIFFSLLSAVFSGAVVFVYLYHVAEIIFTSVWDKETKMMLRRKRVIETINDLLKNRTQIVHSRHRAISNFIMNLISAIGAYCFFDNKPEALRGYTIENDKLLALF